MTLCYHAERDRANLHEAADILKQGGTVVFPTETVYGLGANGLDEAAVRKIFIAKGRPADNPLILHIASLDWLDRLVVDVPPITQTLIDAFWPGPLTLILRRRDFVPDIVTAGLDTVAIRMPSHPLARAIIAAADLPIAAPSANLSGKPSPTKADHVIADMMGRVDLIIDGGDVEHGLESTVLDLSVEPPLILRPGAITYEQLRAFCPTVQLDKSLLVSFGKDKPRAPGMKYRHYAPRAAVFVVDLAHSSQEIDALIQSFTEKGHKVRYIDESAERLAGQLFSLFRSADADGYDVILVKAVPTDQIGLAVMNRLLKAAEYKII
ncbi:MAG: threonylcarbamoyl-AMP synthase [Clostridiales bacterium]|nr:MAG: threonylcarbamoyl-AMP synthase [Clostridiales bacterium]